MKTLARIFLIVFTLFSLLWIGLVSIEEITNKSFDVFNFFSENQFSNFLDLIDKNPLSSFSILFSIFLLFVGKNDKNIHSHIGSIFIIAAVMFIFFTTLVKGDVSVKFCIVAGIASLSYYVMYSLGRRFQVSK